MKFLLLMSGSIACAKASALISTWVKEGHEVRVACTLSVANFIGHATLEGFSGHPVLGDAFASGQVMDHIHLARWADVIVAAPATSNLINKFAAGIADDAVTSLWQASYGQDKPMFVVPAMNTHMWEYPATKASVRKLGDWGIRVLPTASGDLACGEIGAGRMLEPEEILRLIRPSLTVRAAQPQKVLLTAGGTREPIDSVRYIGNYSTGRTAAVLADALCERGHEVTHLGAVNAVRPRSACVQLAFSTYQDLASELQILLSSQQFDLVIHAAAVSDFSVDHIEQAGQPAPNGAKLSSGNGITLHLKPNAKLLDQFRGWSANPDLRIIAFKLTDAADESARTRAIGKMFEQAGANAVVHNDVREIRNGQHPYALHVSPAKALACANSAELGARIIDWLEDGSLEKGS